MTRGGASREGRLTTTGGPAHAAPAPPLFTVHGRPLSGPAPARQAVQAFRVSSATSSSGSSTALSGSTPFL